MITIILYGDLKDKKITNLLLSSLEGKFNIMYQTPFCITSYVVKDSCDNVVVIETDVLNFIESTNTIFVFKNIINNKIDIKIEGNINVILYSQNYKAIDFLKKYKISNIITYGYYSTDTLTLASFNDETKIVCLQREIKTIDGQMVDPFEVKAAQNDITVDMLPIYGIKILLDIC